MSLKTPMKKRNVSSIVTPKPNAPVNPTATPNDDAKERKLRRKSAMDRRRSELATPKPRELAASMKALNQVEDGIYGDLDVYNSAEKAKINLPQLTPEELNRRFEEWMKIAADNKINMHNTWDFALIDYFYDMRLLKDGGTINFQKASCTLDGCVKIYSSRVDSVATETGKLLTGLTDAPGKGDQSDEEAERANATNRRAKKRGANVANTLAADGDALNLKKFDLELAADPLFRKACADFDEGGASGLLLNNLNVDNSGRLLFDAGGEPGFGKGHKKSTLGDDLSKDFEIEANSKNLDASILDIIIDITNSMGDKEIAPLLHDYVLEKDDSVDFDAIINQINSYVEKEYESEDESITLNNDLGDEDVNNIDDFLNFGDNDAPSEGLNILEPFGNSLLTGESNAEEQSTNDPSALSFNFNSEDAFFSYFDTNSKKNWAGPEHWKVAFPKPIVNKPNSTGEISSSQTKNSKNKKDKEVFLIDFSKNEVRDTKEIFAEPTKLSQLQLPKSALNPSNKHLLPVDMQFNSKKIFSLFLKPTLEFKAHKPSSSKIGSQQSKMSTIPTEAGVFAVDGEDGFNDFGGYDDDDDDDFDQIHEETDSTARSSSAEIGEGEAANMSMVETLLHGGSGVAEEGGLPKLNVIKPLYLQYAKISKKVDVKRLKDNIWRGISDIKPEIIPEEFSDAPADSNKDEIKDKSKNSILGDGVDLLAGEHKFSDVVSGLKNSYPAEKLNDISVPFCFICLLHLANEKNLEIQSSQDTNDLIIFNPSAESVS